MATDEKNQYRVVEYKRLWHDRCGTDRNRKLITIILQKFTKHITKPKTATVLQALDLGHAQKEYGEV